MVRRLYLLVACLVSMMFFCGASLAQQEPEPTTFSQEELDQLLAPIALYPDALLTQVLMAATYPMETVQAARFVRENPGLRGDALARAVEGQPWDPSVMALVEFPSVLGMMEDQLAWTQKLGDAFLAQPDAVMDTIQSLRARAQAAGYLESNSRQRVVMQDSMIVIESPTPELLYVPYYDPTVVYGRWWWPDRRPMVWAPPPGYHLPSYGNAVAGAIAFGVGVAIIGSIFHEARPNWRHHNIVFNHNNRRPGGGIWKHNPEHRRGTVYRDPATRNRFWSVDPNSSRRETYRGRVPTDQPHRPNIGVPLNPQPGVRTWTGQQRRPGASPGIERSQSRRSPIDAFNPVGSAGAVHSQAERGRASREASRFNPATSSTATRRSDSNPGQHRAPGEDRRRKH